MPRLRSLHWAAVTAAIVAAALLGIPATRWIVLEQTCLQFGRSPYLEGLMVDLGVKELPDGHVPQPYTSGDAAVRAAAVKLHDDAGAQIVLATLGRVDKPGATLAQAAAALRQVASRMPDKPEIWAAILRFDCSSNVHIGRDKEQNYTDRTPTPTWLPKFAQPVSSPEQLRAFVGAAEAGERCDPRNAFFTYMRMAGLLALKRDDEALTALHEAAAKPDFDDYCWVELDARVRVEHQALGRHGAVAEVAQSAAALFPHYATMRAAARVVQYRFIRLEQAGRRGEALRVRHDLMRFAGTMRAGSRTPISALVSIALGHVAGSWPGGHKVDGTAPYLDYARSTASPGEAVWAKRQFDAASDAQSIIHQGMRQSPTSGASFRILLAKWDVGLALLAVILWCAVLGGLASRFREKPEGWCAWLWGALALALGGWTAYSGMCNARLFSAYPQVVDELTGDVSNAGYAFALTLLSIIVPAATAGGILLICTAAGIRMATSRQGWFPSVARTCAWAWLLLLLAYTGLLVDTARHEDELSAALAETRRSECAQLARIVGRAWPPAEP